MAAIKNLVLVPNVLKRYSSFKSGAKYLLNGFNLIHYGLYWRHMTTQIWVNIGSGNGVLPARRHQAIT